jgi:hypothetical protein
MFPTATVPECFKLARVVGGRQGPTHIHYLPSRLQRLQHLKLGQSCRYLSRHLRPQRLLQWTILQQQRLLRADSRNPKAERRMTKNDSKRSARPAKSSGGSSILELSVLTRKRWRRLLCRWVRKKRIEEMMIHLTRRCLMSVDAFQTCREPTPRTGQSQIPVIQTDERCN